MPPTPDATLFAYDADQNTDGSWNIRGLPFFAEVPEGAHGDNPAIDRDWLEKAVAKDAERRTEGYIAPAHLRHHDTFETAERAGGMVLREVQEILYEGEPVASVFGDLVNIPDSLYQAIRDGVYPYRSVEIHDYEEPEINSIALLDSEVPFFRFPNLSIGHESPTGARALALSAFRRNSLVAGCANSGKARGYLFNARAAYSGAPVLQEPPIMPKTTEKSIDERLDALTLAVEGLVKTFSAQPSCPAHFADAKKKADEDEDAEKFEDEDEKDGEFSEEEDDEKSMKACGKDCDDKDGEFEDDEDEDGKFALGDAPPAPEPEIKADPPVTGKEVATADFSAEVAEIVASEKVAKFEAKEAATARFDAAMETLDGFHLTTKTKDRLKTFAARGQEALDALVEAFQASLSKDPEPTLKAAMKAGSQIDCPDVAAYSGDAKTLDRARVLKKQFDALSGTGMSSTLPEFLKINLGR